MNKAAAAEAESVLPGWLPRSADLLPQTRLILDARDARPAAGHAAEPEPEPEAEL